MIKAFTLVELIIVIFILATLTAAVAPIINSSKTDAQRVRIQADMEVIKNACYRFYADTGEWAQYARSLMVNGYLNHNYSGWNGPYLDRIPVDPCGCEYHLGIDISSQHQFVLRNSLCIDYSKCPTVSQLQIY